MQRLALSVGESGEGFFRDGGTRGGEEVGKTRGDARTEERTAASHCPYGAEHVVLVVVLEHVAAGAHSGETETSSSNMVTKDTEARIGGKDTPGSLY